MALSKPAPLARSRRLYDQHFWIETCTFGEQPRRCMNKTKKEQQKDAILQHVCALLNSGGGILSAGFENKDYDYETMGLGADVEEHLTKLLHPSVIEDFIEFTTHGNTLQLFVKSWCSDTQRAKLCSIDSGLRERSGTSTPSIIPNGVLDFIKKKHKGPSYFARCAKRPKLPQKAEDFYDDEVAQLNQVLDFGESVNVEFKSFDSETHLGKRLKENLPKYLSAFANTKGGFLFIGVDDKTKKVVGCGQGMNSQDIEQMVLDICRRVRARAVHVLDCVKKMAWSVDSKVFRVENGSIEEPRYIIALKVHAFCCAVFEEDPKCWHVEGDKIARIDASSWLGKMQLSDPDHDLIKRFESVLSLKDSPPQCRPVYSTQNIAKLQEKIFSVQGEKITIKREFIPQDVFVKYPSLLNLHPILSKNGPGILVMSTSWAVDVNLPRNKAVICEALLVTTDHYPTLFSWVESGIPELWQYVSKTAFNIKQKLVNLGGYTERLCVIPHLVDCQTGELILNEADGGPPYPESYILGDVQEVVALLQSLAIVVLSFTSPLSDTLGCEFFNLLTEEQFSILCGYTGIKRLFIHGPPGSGKTLIAMEKIQRIQKSESCEIKDILYLCENVGLRDFVRKKSICLCETRSSFMMKAVENFTSIKHIIVDEGQNFRVEDGDWYKKAERLMQGKHGFFWIFVDYFQRSHTSTNGLPPLTSQEKAYLSEVVRNSKEVFDAMSDLIGRIADKSKTDEAKHLQNMRESIKLTHDFRGEIVTLTKRESVEPEVARIVKSLLQKGHTARDIAVLYSTLENVNKRGYRVTWEGIPVVFGTVGEVDQNKIVLDTIRRFSGLERNIVIVVDPVVHPFQNEIQLNILLSAYSRARIRLYILHRST
ncbi:schlafen family member 13 [Pygocentrus nattereri]|uniref:schlafen family member 13 n=1 Tax=Pygocentrus nattereri TaxID=42514 RepID=UPI00189132BE|nr:schlafen family member 13 [Pygocentrus nattereri]